MLYNHIKVLTDDIEQCLDYGNQWSIDESWVVRKPLSTRGTKTSQEYPRICVVGIVDVQTKTILIMKAFEKRLNGIQISKMLSEASQRISKIPELVLTDAYLAYAKAIKNAFGEKSCDIQKIQVLAYGQHNNPIERFWKSMRKYLWIDPGRFATELIEPYNELFRVYFNHVRLHETINSTPAECAGYGGRKIRRMVDLIQLSMDYDKSFVSNLARIGNDISIEIKKELVAIKFVGSTVQEYSKINHILIQHGFVWSESEKRWVMNTTIFHDCVSTVKRQFGKITAARTFSVCTQCGIVAPSRQRVREIFGFRNMGDGTVTTQPQCRKCRSAHIQRRVEKLLKPHSTKIDDYLV